VLRPPLLVFPLSIYPWLKVSESPSRLLHWKERTAEAQPIRSPVSGRVVEVKVRDLRPGEVVAAQ